MTYCKLFELLHCCTNFLQHLYYIFGITTLLHFFKIFFAETPVQQCGNFKWILFLWSLKPESTLVSYSKTKHTHKTTWNLIFSSSDFFIFQHYLVKLFKWHFNLSRMITKWIVWCSHKSLLKFSHAGKEAHMWEIIV